MVGKLETSFSGVHWIKQRPLSDVTDPLGMNLRVGARLGGQLLYCITSVTLRARYYSFLPWCMMRYREVQRGTPGDPGMEAAVFSREQALAIGCVAHHEGEACARGGVIGSRLVVRNYERESPRDFRGDSESSVSLVVPWLGTGPEHRSSLDAAQTRLVRGALMASLRDGTHQGTWTYVVQESTLERDVGMSGHDRAQRRIELTGEGLSDALRELVEREGPEAALEFLLNVRIRFADGARGIGRAPRFSLKIHDPDRGASADWAIDDDDRVSWQEALVTFAAEHEQYRLRRHAQRGNVNGMENFVDIFATVVG
jgi:hypothetical protein